MKIGVSIDDLADAPEGTATAFSQIAIHPDDLNRSLDYLSTTYLQPLLLSAIENFRLAKQRSREEARRPDSTA